jgi:hypothetical protein
MGGTTSNKSDKDEEKKSHKKSHKKDKKRELKHGSSEKKKKKKKKRSREEDSDNDNDQHRSDGEDKLSNGASNGTLNGNGANPIKAALETEAKIAKLKETPGSTVHFNDNDDGDEEMGEFEEVDGDEDAPRQRPNGAGVSFSNDIKQDKHNKSTLKVEVEVCKANSAKEQPMTVNFSNGAPPLNEKEQHLPLFQIYRQAPGEASGRYIYGTDEKCTYVAESSTFEDDSERHMKVLVGIYDRQDSTLKVHQAAEKGTVFGLQQHITCKLKEPSEVSVGTRAFGSYQEASASLYADFGSTKKKKVLKSQAANRINVSSVVGNQKTVVKLIDPRVKVKDESATKDDSNDKVCIVHVCCYVVPVLLVFREKYIWVWFPALPDFLCFS